MNILFKFLLFFVLAIESLSAGSLDVIPHVKQKAQDSFQFDYAYANQHRAFAIAPGGAWSWQSDKSTADEAKKAALDACSKYTQQKCVLYSVDEKVVFNKQEWPGLWGPYKTKQQAKQSETGNKVGQLFPNLIFTDPKGIKKAISDLRGKVVFVHLWGCWCPSCRIEFVTLIDMYRILQDTMGDQIEFVVLQLREPISQARNWASSNGLDVLPLSDSGVKNSDDKFLTVKTGDKIPDRQLANVFPASYVVDKHGVVVFSHMGSIDDWSEYISFFKHVVEKSGK
ncbi:MAG: redoxin family protein [Gammaproteobacteria bacterium]|nr:redoxin family protein [Gammaproteobacteria bacterium]MDH5735935.1 redoxin family protein [Gammaproteobacteria bacterium]